MEGEEETGESEEVEGERRRMGRVQGGQFGI